MGLEQSHYIPSMAPVIKWRSNIDWARRRKSGVEEICRDRTYESKKGKEKGKRTHFECRVGLGSGRARFRGGC